MWDLRRGSGLGMSRSLQLCWVSRRVLYQGRADDGGGRAAHLDGACPVPMSRTSIGAAGCAAGIRGDPAADDFLHAPALYVQATASFCPMHAGPGRVWGGAECLPLRHDRGLLVGVGARCRFLLSLLAGGGPYDVRRYAWRLSRSGPRRPDPGCGRAAAFATSSRSFGGIQLPDRMPRRSCRAGSYAALDLGECRAADRAPSSPDPHRSRRV